MSGRAFMFGMLFSSVLWTWLYLVTFTAVRGLM